MNKWDEFKVAFDDAKRTISAADSHVQDMAKMVAGRLRKSDVSIYVLIELKKELHGFNMHTKTWGDK